MHLLKVREMVTVFVIRRDINITQLQRADNLLNQLQFVCINVKFERPNLVGKLISSYKRRSLRSLINFIHYNYCFIIGHKVLNQY